MNKNTTIVLLVIVALAAVLWWLVSMGDTAPMVTASPSVSAMATASVTPKPTISPTATPQANLTITSPLMNATVTSPIVVKGRARIFENQFTVQIKDAAGNIIAKREAVMSDAPDSSQFGNYSVSIPIPAGVTGTLKIESLAYSAKGDGSFEGYATVTVKVK